MTPQVQLTSQERLKKVRADRLAAQRTFNRLDSAILQARLIVDPSRYTNSLFGTRVADSDLLTTLQSTLAKLLREEASALANYEGALPEAK